MIITKGEWLTLSLRLIGVELLKQLRIRKTLIFWADDIPMTTKKAKGREKTNDLILLNALEISETFEYAWFLGELIFFSSPSLSNLFSLEKLVKYARLLNWKSSRHFSLHVGEFSHSLEKHPWIFLLFRNKKWPFLFYKLISKKIFVNSGGWWSNNQKCQTFEVQYNCSSAQ